MNAAEQAAVDALRAPVRRKCACRSSILALPDDPAPAVWNHQQNDPLHRLWSAAGGMDQMLTPEERYAHVPDMPPARMRKTG